MTKILRSAPAALRNRDPILNVLREVLPQRGLVLEIASGTGEHIVHFAQHCPDLIFQPSDPDDEALQTIAARIEDSRGGNVRTPIKLDTAMTWPLETADAVICINMVHISPWRSTEGLMAGAAAILSTGAPLYLYGPYRRDGLPTAPSNEAFDTSLRSQNSAWGLRSLEDVTMSAERSGFMRERIVDMPANNLSVVFRKL